MENTIKEMFAEKSTGDLIQRIKDWSKNYTGRNYHEDLEKFLDKSVGMDYNSYRQGVLDGIGFVPSIEDLKNWEEE